MPHLTAPGTLVALNYESYPTAPSTSSIFADLAAQWVAFGGGAGTQLPLPPPLPLPMPCFPGEPCPPGVGGAGPGPGAGGSAAPKSIEQCRAECQGLPTTAFFACMSKCGGFTPEQLTRLNVTGIWQILAVVIGIILVLIAVALIVR